MNLFQKYIQRGVTMALCVAMTLQAQDLNADDPCCPQETTCEPVVCPTVNICEPCSRYRFGNVGLALAAIGLGAAAGAAAGYAAGHSKNHNDCSSCCNSCGCAKLKNSSLSFLIEASVNFSFTAPTPNQGSVDATAFVITPNGLTVQGTVFPLYFGTGSTGETDVTIENSVILSDDCCGTYQLGIAFESPYPISSMTLYDFFIYPTSSCSDVDGIGVLISDASFEFFTTAEGLTEFQGVFAQFALSPDCCIKKESCCTAHKR